MGFKLLVLFVGISALVELGLSDESINVWALGDESVNEWTFSEDLFDGVNDVDFYEFLGNELRDYAFCSFWSMNNESERADSDNFCVPSKLGNFQPVKHALKFLEDNENSMGCLRELNDKCFDKPTSAVKDLMAEFANTSKRITKERVEVEDLCNYIDDYLAPYYCNAIEKCPGKINQQLMDATVIRRIAMQQYFHSNDSDTIGGIIECPTNTVFINSDLYQLDVDNIGDIDFFDEGIYCKYYE